MTSRLNIYSDFLRKAAFKSSQAERESYLIARIYKLRKAERGTDVTFALTQYIYKRCFLKKVKAHEIPCGYFLIFRLNLPICHIIAWKYHAIYIF